MVEQEAFLPLVVEALAHLYEPTRLSGCPLARLLTDVGLIESTERLARYLIAAVDELRPVGAVPRGSSGWRQYRYLYLRYIEDHGHRLIADDLGLSTRQATREHERGLRAFNGLLWSRYVTIARRMAPDHQIDLPRPPALATEILDLDVPQIPVPTSLREVVEGVLATISRMATVAGVDLRSELPENLPPVVVSKVALRHILLSLLDYVIQRSTRGAVLSFTAVERHGITDLLLSVRPSGSQPQGSTRGEDHRNGIEFARRLAGLQGIQFDFHVSASSMEAVLAVSTARTRAVLHVDDSPDMGRLFRQYLQGTGYGLVHVRTAERAIQVVRQAVPDVIVLDVLLPTEDGWQLLEQLRAAPETATTPVIVCSVLPEATLAASLGVDAFLAKPITRSALLAALVQSCPSAPEAHRDRPEHTASVPPS